MGSNLLESAPPARRWILYSITGLGLGLLYSTVIRNVSFGVAVIATVVGYPLYRTVRWVIGFPLDSPPTPIDTRQKALSTLVIFSATPVVVVFLVTFATGNYGASSSTTPSPNALQSALYLGMFGLTGFAFHTFRTFQYNELAVNGPQAIPICVDILARLPIVLYFLGVVGSDGGLAGFSASPFAQLVWQIPLWLWGIPISLSVMVGYVGIRLLPLPSPSVGRLSILNHVSGVAGSLGAVVRLLEAPTQHTTTVSFLEHAAEPLPYQEVDGPASCFKRIDSGDSSLDSHITFRFDVRNNSADRAHVVVAERLPSQFNTQDIAVFQTDGVNWNIDSTQNIVGFEATLSAGDSTTATYRLTLDDLWTDSQTKRNAVAQLCRRKPTLRAEATTSQKSDSSTDQSDRNTSTESAGETSRQNDDTPSGADSPSDDVAGSEWYSAANIVDPGHQYLTPPPDVDLGTVAGLHDIKEQLRKEVIDPFIDPRYDRYGVGKVNGVLFYGPPGTGKTYLAEALAGELRCNLLRIDVGEIRSQKFGDSLDNLSERFASARSNAPCVIFIDELDALAPDRDSSNLHQSRQEVVSLLLQTLAEINENNEDVLIIAATNQPEAVDGALKRTGRFDLTIEVPLPDIDTRLAILRHELQQFDGEVSTMWEDSEFIDAFAKATEGFAASDIVDIVESAQRAAIREASPQTTPTITSELVFDQLDDLTAKREQDTAAEYIAEVPDIDFSDVGGMNELKETLRQKIIAPLEQPERYKEYGLETVTGILLYGPPGTGKTYISKAVAGETEYAFLSITAGDVISKWIGESAKQIRELFEQAKAIQPCIILIDEIDALASKRGGLNGHDETDRAVNELLNALTELEGEDVIVIGTTNRRDIIDPAITRSGRLGESIEVPPPDTEARLDILQLYLEERPIDEAAIDWDRLGKLTSEDQLSTPLVAADLVAIVDEAARYAMQESAGRVDEHETDSDELVEIDMTHLETAIDSIEPTLES